MITSNPELQLASELVQYTNKNIFLTGKAGTGKTTFLHSLKATLPKRMVVVAPTGVAAINAGGVTIHSFFQLPLGPITPGSVSGSGLKQEGGDPRVRRFNREKINIIRSIDLLVIDEISMVRADLLDGVDEVLRRFRDRSKPFGGVQLLMIGDLHQLAPVVKDHEWNMLREYYDTFFFFGSRALQKTDYVSIELKRIYRQSDREFIDLLNSIRNNQLTPDILNKLNSYHKPGVLQEEQEGYIILTTHNNQSQRINTNKLNFIKGKSYVFKASVDGNFPEHAYPTDLDLELKEGAQVMFIRNDPSPEKLYFNGKIGTIVNIDDDEIYVHCPDDDDHIQVSQAEWKNIKYSIDDNTKEIKETIEGNFIQYPLKLAWAITIHKSQGLTFDRAIIDANAAFAHGQVYVALSRCRSLDGLVLSSPITTNSIRSNQTISTVTEAIEKNHPSESQMEQWKAYYQKELLIDLFNFTQNLRQLDSLRRIVFDNLPSLNNNLFEMIKGIQDTFIKQILEVSNKFHNQINNHLLSNSDAESNADLQERIRKGSAYFTAKIENLAINPLTSIAVETDNKSVRQAVNESLDKTTEGLHVKLNCIKSCQNGFLVKEYLCERAKGAVETPKKKPKSSDGQWIASSSSNHPQLYGMLKEWRDRKVDDTQLPHYMVLPLKGVLQLSNDLPTTRDALLEVNGVGAKKVEMFGDEIMEIIKGYCEERRITPPTFIPKPKKEKKEKPQKGASHAATLGLAKEGKTIPQIAQERGLAVSTIEGHISQLVGQGELNVGQFVTADKIETISQYFISKKTTNLNPAKEALGDQYSYGELRLVMKHLMAKGVIKVEQ